MAGKIPNIYSMIIHGRWPYTSLYCLIFAFDLNLYDIFWYILSWVAEVVRGHGGLRRNFLARTYAILSRTKICRDLRTFCRSLAKKVPF